MNGLCAKCQSQLLVGSDAGNTTDTVRYLLNAAAYGHVKCLVNVVNSGVDVNATDDYDRNALLFTVWGDYVECAEILINSGADVNCMNGIVLNGAVERDSCRCVDLLLKKKAELKKHKLDEDDSRIIFQALRNACDKCVDKLINAGADVSTTDEYGVTALMAAARSNRTKYVDLFLGMGHDVNAAIEGKEDTALILAATAGNLEIIQKLIQAGANVNKNNAYDSCPFLEAARHGSPSCLMELKNSGADINATNNGGQNALNIAVMCSQPESVEYLIGLGMELDRRSNCYQPALMRVAIFKEDKCLKLLLNQGADVNITGEDGWTALMGCGGNNLAMERLLQAGANINATDNRGNSALFFAAGKHQPHSVKFLIEKGADVNLINNEGDTCISSSIILSTWDVIITDVLECIKLLLKASAHINVTNNVGHNALRNGITKSGCFGEGVCMLLYAAGETLQEQTDIERLGLNTLTHAAAVPEFLKHSDLELCLKHMTRQVIRAYLIHLNPQVHLFGRVNQLGLPPALTQYLLYGLSLE